MFKDGGSSVKKTCPSVFSTAQELYCEGSCGEDWLDSESGCQESDANAFCKLKLCDENAIATSFKVTKATDNTTGFACDFSRKRRKNIKEFEAVYEGTWFGITDVSFTNNIGVTQGSGRKGDVVSSVTCQPSGIYNYHFRTSM